MTKRELAKYQDGYMIVTKGKYITLHLWHKTKKECEEDFKLLELSKRYLIVPYYKIDNKEAVLIDRTLYYI